MIISGSNASLLPCYTFLKAVTLWWVDSHPFHCKPLDSGSQNVRPNPFHLINSWSSNSSRKIASSYYWWLRRHKCCFALVKLIISSFWQIFIEAFYHLHSFQAIRKKKGGRGSAEEEEERKWKEGRKKGGRDKIIIIKEIAIASEVGNNWYCYSNIDIKKKNWSQCRKPPYFRRKGMLIKHGALSCFSPGSFFSWKKL